MTTRATTWCKKRLADVADLSLGKMLDQNKNRGEYLPYLANVNVRWGSFDLSDLREMRFESHERVRYGLQSGDIVMCEGGEPGRCALWKDEQPGMMIQKALHRIRARDGLHNTFLYYSLLHRAHRGAFAALFTGATIKHLPTQNLAKIEVALPPLLLQVRIAGILSAYDDLIENNRRRIRLLERETRLIYEEWFVRLRFPGHEYVRIINGVPEDWEVKTLGDIARTNERSYGAQELPEQVNYIDISSVAKGRIINKVTMPSGEAPGRARRRARSGDVIWSNVRPNLRAFALVLEPEENDVVSTGFTVLTPVAVPFSYLYLLVTTERFVSHLENHATGVSYPAVRPDDFERARVLCPAMGVLELFHKTVGPMFRFTSILEREVRRLQDARDLLLPRLMNGELEP